MVSAKSWCVVVAALVAGACAPASSNKSGGGDTASMASDRAAVDSVRSKYEAAFKAGDAAAIAALYTSDGMSMTNMQPTANGADGITALNKAMFDQYTLADAKISGVKTDISGDLAVDIGTYRFTGIPKAKGDTLRAEGRYIVVLKKQADGTWKVVADMDNTASPPPMPPAPPKKK